MVNGVLPQRGIIAAKTRRMPHYRRTGDMPGHTGFNVRRNFTKTIGAFAKKRTIAANAHFKPAR
jgi:hypothetical protein